MKTEKCYQFGKNWSKYLLHITEENIKSACNDLKRLLGKENLKGKTFLDIGSGSGLMSLAARKMGAKIISFDYDEDSVNCTKQVREKYYHDDQNWEVLNGSVLDTDFMNQFESVDIIYSWGVIHHTGNMWAAITNIINLAEKNSSDIVLAIYNDQGWISKYWFFIKRVNNKNLFLKIATVMFHMPYLYVVRILYRIFTGRFELERGMLYWYDMLDWLGGYPFEASTPNKIISHFEKYNYSVRYKNLCGNRHGCNEYYFESK